MYSAVNDAKKSYLTRVWDKKISNCYITWETMMLFNKLYVIYLNNKNYLNTQYIFIDLIWMLVNSNKVYQFMQKKNCLRPTIQLMIAIWR